MILRIVAYRDVFALRKLMDGEDRSHLDDGVIFPVPSAFADRAPDIDAATVYAPAEAFSFNVGSYSRYHRWLEQLSTIAGIAYVDLFWQHPKPAPFAELLDFVDCDGTIGATVCRKLAADFASLAQAASMHRERYFREQYSFWRHAFEVASSGGCVVFREVEAQITAGVQLSNSGKHTA